MPEVDLLIAGAGGGLAGALRGAQLGMRVLVVDSNEHFRRGNNTAMSTAMVPGAGSRYQHQLGIEDSPAQFLADVLAKTGGAADPSVARAATGVSAELVEWLADHVGLPIELPTDFRYPGHRVQRLHTIPGRHGSGLVRRLADEAARHPSVDLLAPCRLLELPERVDPSGPFTAVLEHPDGGREEVTSSTVLLATNGYGANPELVAEHLPEIAGAAYHGSEHSRGDALRVGRRHGAAVGCLDAYQGHAGLSASARTLLTWTTVAHGAVLVNMDGRRFGDESLGYSEYAARLAEQPGGTGWVVLDERIHQLSMPFADYRDVVRSGAVRHGTGAAELASEIGIPSDALTLELAEAAEVARGERPADRFGRTSFERPLTAPLHAVRVVPALFHTQGGLLVDEHAQVRDRAGTPVPGLYASGGAAVGMSGHGAAGYLAGNGLLPALGLAYLAATHASRKGTQR